MFFNQYIFAFLLVLVMLSLAAPSPLFPYGTHVNDYSIAHPEQYYYELQTSANYYIFGRFLPVTIHHKGYLTLFEKDHVFFSDGPRAFPILHHMIIAPYWSDTGLLHSRPGNIYYREIEEGPDLDSATTQIRAALGDAYRNFTANSMLIVTYHKLAASEKDEKDTNTFQAAIITNGKHTFLQFNYEHLTWPKDSSHKALMGINVGDGQNFYSHESSFTRRILDLQVTSNVNVTGKWMFRIDSSIQGKTLCDKTNCFNGQCQPGGICLCDPNWIGGNCDIMYNHCSTYTCIHGACTPVSATVSRCDCDPGWTGDSCDVNTISIQSIPFLTPRTKTTTATSDSSNSVENDTSKFAIQRIPFATLKTKMPTAAADSVDSSGNYTSMTVPSYSSDLASTASLQPSDRTSSLSNTENPSDPVITTEIVDLYSDNQTMESVSVTEGLTVDTPAETEMSFSSIVSLDTTAFSSYPTIMTNPETTEQSTMFTATYTAAPSCDDDPCENGNCTEVNGTILCLCFPGYTGIFCEEDIDECMSNPCIHGYCENLINEYFCNCTEGYTGVHCGIDINECASEPCQNGGSCVDLIADYQCICPRGYVGKNCENVTCVSEAMVMVYQREDRCKSSCEEIAYEITNLEGCLLSSCLWGSASNTINFRSSECEILRCFGEGNLNISCDLPAVEGRIIYTYLESKPCEGFDCGKGECKFNTTSGITSCVCEPGYTGKKCETMIDPCSDNTSCLNGGICQPVFNGSSHFICLCPHGYFGERCESDEPISLYRYTTSFTIRNQKFNVTLTDPTSPEYQELAGNLTMLIERELQNISSLVTNVTFSDDNGFVKTDMEIGYNDPVSVSDVRNVTQAALENSEFDVDTNTIAVKTEVTLFACDFETDLCDISEKTMYSDISWTRHFGASPRTETGPRLSKYGDYYALLSTVNASYGDQSVQELTRTDAYLQYNGEVCIEFKYYMYGPTMGSLSVNQTKVNQPLDQGQLLWREAALSVNEWQSAYISTMLTPEYSVFFIFEVGNGQQSDIAIDDVKIKVDLTDCQQYLSDPCSRYRMSISELFCLQNIWQESCLSTGDGYPDTLVSPSAQYARLVTGNGFFWNVRYLSMSANDGDAQSISYCYGEYSHYIRLVDGTNNQTGRVEVYYSGEWGTICDDEFDDIDADVICRQLGYYKGVARTSSYFGEGSGTIMLKNVQCQTNNTNLYECEKIGRLDGRWQCSHSEDSGVICVEVPGANYTIGADVKERTYIDTSINAVFIPSIQGVIPTAGRITKWTFYNVNTSLEIVLQVWRYLRSVMVVDYQEMYQLVNETAFSRNSCQTTANVTQCPVLNPFYVEENDVIGFYFKDKNPIPYSVKSCYGTNEQLRYVNNVRDPSFDEEEFAFSLASYASNPCRDYSFQATIENIDPPATTTTEAPPEEIKLPIDALFACSFEGGDSDWCDMSPREAWNKSRGVTPFPQTGPSLAYDGDVYVYQTAQTDGNTTRLETPAFDPVNGTSGCLTFFYSMVGEGTRRLLIRYNDKVIYSLEKYQTNGQEWGYFQYDLLLSNNSKFSFEAVGLPPLSDTALDRIVVYNSWCHNLTDPPPITTPPTTEPPVGPDLDMTPGTYYVSQEKGNDVDNCGTGSNPCKSISYVLAKSSAVNILYLQATDDPYTLNLDDVKKNKVRLSLLGLVPTVLQVTSSSEKMAYENLVYTYIFENLTLIGDLKFSCPDDASLALVLVKTNMPQGPGIIQALDCVTLEVNIIEGVFDGVYMEFFGKDTTVLFDGILMKDTVEASTATTHDTGIFFNLQYNEGSHMIKVANSSFVGLGVAVTGDKTRRPVAALSIDTFDTLTEVKLFVVNCSFLSNSRAIDVAMKGYNSVQIRDCTFVENTGDGAGGAIRIASHMDPGVGESAEVRQPDVYIVNSVFISNFANSSESYKEDEDVYYKLWAPGSGGAIYVYVLPRSPLKVDGFVQIESCTFSNNTGTANGGTVFISPVILTSISNCTIDNAKTTDMPRARMGDVLFGSSPMSVENVTVMVNTADDATPIIYYQASDLLNDKLYVSSLTMTCAKGFDIDETSTTFANGLQSLQLYCSRCGSDYYSLDVTSVSVDNSGSFTDEQISCHKCPYGADCSDGIINLDNFWGDVDSNSSEVSMYLCPDDYCVENTSLHVQYSSCNDHRQGTLCGRCEEGFSEALFGTACIDDDECGLTEPTSILLLVLVMIRGIIFVALLLFAEEWESVVDSTIEKISPKGKAEQVQVVTREGFLTIYFYFIQTVELVQVDIIIEPDETKNIVRPEDVLPEILLDGVDISDEMKAASCFIPGITPVQKVALSFVYPAYAFVLLLLVYLGTGLCCICRKAEDKPRLMRNGTARIVLVLLELFLFTYQGIAESLLQLIQCVNVQGNSVLWIDGTVECLQTWQYAVIAITCIFVCPFFLILLFGPKVLKEKKITLGFFFAALVLPVFCFLPIILVFFGAFDNIPPITCNRKKRKYSVKELEQRLTRADETYKGFHEPKRKRLESVPSASSTNSLSDVEVDEVDMREAVADSLVGTYRSWEEDGDDFLGGVCWEGVLNLQRIILVVVYIFTPDVLLRQMLLCSLMLFILLLQMKLKPFSGRMSNRAQTGALSVIVMIAMFNLVRAALFHTGKSPQDMAYVMVIVLEWIEVVCTTFLPWLLILSAFLAVCAKGVKNKMDESRSDVTSESVTSSLGFANNAYEMYVDMDGNHEIPANDVGNRQPLDPGEFSASLPGPLPLPWRQRRYTVARQESNASETMFGRAPNLPPERPTVTNWKSLGFQ